MALILRNTVTVLVLFISLTQTSDGSFVDSIKTGVRWLAWGSWQCMTTTSGCAQTRYRNCSTGHDSNCAGSSYQLQACTTCKAQADAGWTEWTSWACTYTPGCLVARVRQCPAGSTCQGQPLEKEDCTSHWDICSSSNQNNHNNHHNIPVNWLQWGAWRCNNNNQLGSCIMSRFRNCSTGNDVDCHGESYNVLPCDSAKCAVDGSWGHWGHWSGCSVTCGSGSLLRTRHCSNPAPKNGGDTCPGQHLQTQKCDKPICPVDGMWGHWLHWSSCDVTCGSGHRTRARHCDSPSPLHGGQTCSGSTSQRVVCHQHECQINGGWASWLSWGRCSVTCGSGTKQRTRTCTHPRPQYGGHYCQGSSEDHVTCITVDCPVNGGWGTWQSWSGCSKTCGNGTLQRTRACDHPKPQYGGNVCPGDYAEHKECYSHCPVNGGWGHWVPWSVCSASCGTGTQQRIRTCSSPKPLFGGKYCPGDYDEQKQCHIDCAVNGGWGSWQSWTGCSKTCGTGTQQRVRACNHPKPQHGGHDCHGDATAHKTCHSDCPIDGHWGHWLPWAGCTASCGTGSQLRIRPCNSPQPQHGGKNCTGDQAQYKQCHIDCPIDGQWGHWLPWAGCTASCGIGSQLRIRPCNSPQPQHGGQNCTGDHVEHKQCHADCPINGGWGHWLPWATCTQTCGSGSQIRIRPCNHPKPENGGAPCQGSAKENQTCSTQSCGIWSNWFYTPCTVTCGTGSKQAMRRCSTGNENDCDGVGFKSESCNETPCPVDGNWGPWHPWGSCSRSCGTGGQRTRHRTCDNPAPAHHGHECVGADVKSESCHVMDCPTWSPWFHGQCSVTCGTGRRMDMRRCSSGHEDQCSGSPVRTMDCHEAPC